MIFFGYDKYNTKRTVKLDNDDIEKIVGGLCSDDGIKIKTISAKEEHIPGDSFEPLDYGKNVFGIMLDDAPRVADKDWVTHEYVTLISVNPLAKGQWHSNGNDIEYIPFAFC